MHFQSHRLRFVAGSAIVGVSQPHPVPSGLVLGAGEIVALFRACADGTPAGASDAAAFALMFDYGLRRAEAVTVALEGAGHLRHARPAHAWATASAIMAKRYTWNDLEALRPE